MMLQYLPEEAQSRCLRCDFAASAIDDILQGIDFEHSPGVSVGVAIDGAVVLRRSFGLASIETPSALTPRTRMRIGSATKQFTALAFMLLCEEGRARPDDELALFLPNLSDTASRVTMRQLMQNVSGLRDSCAIKLDFAGIETRPVPASELVSVYSAPCSINALPGSQWIYNNGAWLLLSAAIERIENSTLEQVLDQRIFRAIGMQDTVLRRWDRDVLANSATNHTKSPDGGWVRADYGMENFLGGGAIASTVDDMLKWLAHMDRPHVGSRDTWREMVRCAQLTNGTVTDYGLGLFINSYRGSTVVHHAGGGVGCSAQVLKLPAARLDVVVMANRDDVSSIEIANRIIDACVPDLPEPCPLGEGQAIKRSFRSPSTGRSVSLFERNGAQIVSIDGDDIEMTRDSNGTLRPANAWRHLKLSIEGAASVPEDAKPTLNDFGLADRLECSECTDADEAFEILGAYRSAEFDIAAMIERDAAGAFYLSTASMFGNARFSLTHFGHRMWRAKALGLRMLYGGVLDFHDIGAGFTFSNYHNRRIVFARGSGPHFQQEEQL